mmetsp:Transcript_98008/g.299608  ORF Transcript_98008/g.299608 Transcript_98008/m.299608 type:complete len:239 (-) Transcript_98008:699-1415(-)
MAGRIFNRLVMVRRIVCGRLRHEGILRRVVPHRSVRRGLDIGSYSAHWGAAESRRGLLVDNKMAALLLLGHDSHERHRLVVNYAERPQLGDVWYTLALVGLAHSPIAPRHTHSQGVQGRGHVGHHSAGLGRGVFFVAWCHLRARDLHLALLHGCWRCALPAGEGRQRFLGCARGCDFRQRAVHWQERERDDVIVVRDRAGQCGAFQSDYFPLADQQVEAGQPGIREEIRRARRHAQTN